MGNRRKHARITTELPKSLIQAINERLVAGETYESIATYLRESGHDISKSSVGRYGKDFLSKLERLRIVKEQARTIMTEGKDGPALEMTEAATQLALQLIMERLVAAEDLRDAKSSEILKALALLERSAVQREKLKMDAGRMVEAAVARIKESLQEELQKTPEILERLVSMVDTVAAETKENQ